MPLVRLASGLYVPAHCRVRGGMPRQSPRVAAGKSGLTVEAGGGGEGSYPNEPSGMTLLLDHVMSNWSDLQDCFFCGDPAFKPFFFIEAGSAPDLDTITDPTAPVDVNAVGRVQFTPGCCGGSNPMFISNEGAPTGTAAGWGFPPPGWTRWYHSIWMKLVNFDPSGDAIHKLVKIATNWNQTESIASKMDGTSFPLHSYLTFQVSGGTTNEGGAFVITGNDIWYQHEWLIDKNAGRIRYWVGNGTTQTLCTDNTSRFADCDDFSSTFWSLWHGHGGLDNYPTGGGAGFVYHNRLYMSYS